MQPVSGLFFDFRLLLFQLLDDTALLYGAPDGQRVVHGGFLTAVDTETGKGTCRDVLCGIGYDLPVECRGGGFPFPDDGQAERRDKVLAIGIGVYLVQEVPRPSPGEVVTRSWISRSRSLNFSMRSSCPVAMILVMSLISLMGCQHAAACLPSGRCMPHGDAGLRIARPRACPPCAL